MAHREIIAADIQAAYADIASDPVERFNTDCTVMPQLIMMWLDGEPCQIRKVEPAPVLLDLLSDDRGLLREAIRGLLCDPGANPQVERLDRSAELRLA
jgi:hypothetical protein